jgi:hypothetical protein
MPAVRPNGGLRSADAEDMRERTHRRITGSQADLDGAAVSSSRISVPRDDRGPIPNRWNQPNRSEGSFGLMPGHGGGSAAIRHYLSMEWHMKRLYHRSSVSSRLLSPKASITLQPNPDFRWVLLWRNNQRHRPPSKC